MTLDLLNLHMAITHHPMTQRQVLVGKLSLSNILNNLLFPLGHIILSWTLCYMLHNCLNTYYLWISCAKKISVDVSLMFLFVYRTRSLGECYSKDWVIMLSIFFPYSNHRGLFPIFLLQLHLWVKRFLLHCGIID